MISIVVSSINDQHYQRFTNSLNDTIGVEFEVIKVDNSIKKLSIAQAYNKGAKSARYDILLFVHEDIVFHTVNWGKCLLNHFNRLVNPGLLGLAGSSYLPISPSDWWVPDSNFRHFHYMENHSGGEIGSGVLRLSDSLQTQKVFVLDGVFLCMSKIIFNKFVFDEELEGFHGYDTSISLRIGLVHTNYFISDILIEHFSSGKPNTLWLMNTIKAYKSIKNNNLKNINKKIEEKSFRIFLSQLKKYGPDFNYKFNESILILKKIFNKFFSLKILFLWGCFQIVYFFQIFEKK